jgi:hypothetical protein
MCWTAEESYLPFASLKQSHWLWGPRIPQFYGYQKTFPAGIRPCLKADNVPLRAKVFSLEMYFYLHIFLYEILSNYAQEQIFKNLTDLIS